MKRKKKLLEEIKSREGGEGKNKKINEIGTMTNKMKI